MTKGIFLSSFSLFLLLCTTGCAGGLDPNDPDFDRKLIEMQRQNESIKRQSEFMYRQMIKMVPKIPEA